MPVEQWDQRKVIRALRGEVTKGMRRAMKHVRVTVRAELSGPAGSPPGGPPGKVDGDLIRAVRHKVKVKRNTVSGFVGVLDDPVQAAKGARLAGGFAGRDRDGRLYSQQPRPWLAPVLRREADKVVEIINRGGGG
jgi:hypothetical protein